MGLVLVFVFVFVIEKVAGTAQHVMVTRLGIFNKYTVYLPY